MLQDTPVETYKLHGIPVYVKREDLVSLEPDLPPLAKIRGIHKVIERLKSEGYKTFGVLDTKVSKAGWGTAAISKRLGVRCILGVPRLKNGSLPFGAQKAQELGAEIYELRSSRYSIMYSRLRKYIESEGGFLLPLGLTCEETVIEVAKIASRMSPEYFDGSLVICAGTGTILSGVVCGLPRIPQQIYSISAGISVKKQRRTVEKFTSKHGFENGMMTLPRISFIPAFRDYYQESPVEVPFPSHPNYDAKAWEWLGKHIHDIPQPILFWNIGA